MFPVLKFGGTSVGSAQRIKELEKIAIGPDPRLIVLSAMSGTTNALVEISASLYEGEKETAKKNISALRKKYEEVVDELLMKPATKEKGMQLVNTHFNHLDAFTLDMFTSNEEKAILAQGELLSTA